ARRDHPDPARSGSARPAAGQLVGQPQRPRRARGGRMSAAERSNSSTGRRAFDSGRESEEAGTEGSADAVGAVVRRLARPHASGGTVIERSVIIAEGSGSAAILSWIADHHGVADSTAGASPA